MAIYTVQDTTMQALGDAVRKKTGNYVAVDEMPVPTFDISFDTTIMESVGTYNGQTYHEVPLNLKEMFGEDYSRIAKLYVSGTYESYIIGFNYSLFNLRLRFRDTETETGRDGRSIDIVKGNSSDPLTGDITTYVDFANIGDNRNKPYSSIQLKVNNWVYTDNDGWYKCNLQIWACDADNKFIVPNTMTPAEMVEKIDGLMTIPDEALIITGSLNQRFINNNMNWFFEVCGDKITTKDIINANSAFSDCNKLKEIPFSLNFQPTTTSNHLVASLFSKCELLEDLPKMNNLRVGECSQIFNNCWRLRYFPENYFDTWDFSYIQNNTNSMMYLFANCYSLRNISSVIQSIWINKSPYSYSSCYNYRFSCCYSLDEVVDLGVSTATLTSNVFTNCFQLCNRIKEITFAVNEDGTPKTANWKGQTIDLSSTVGYSSSSYKSYILNYNSGITADKEVKDDATYQALKDDPDWFSCDVNYSRYNHDSAVNTINSLPDCSSSGGTNTIKFKGAAGALTDGGAINTLTEEEIAVASAKGWSVAFV